MLRRHPHATAIPRLWLLTDERQGASLWQALNRLPRNSGIIVRHYGLDPSERIHFTRRVEGIARRRGLRLYRTAIDHRPADGLYAKPTSPARRGGLPLAVPVHDMREIDRAHRMRADCVLLSPLFATRSHPGRAGLGPVRFAALARLCRVPVIALGGVEARHQALVRQLGASGWAGIDAFIGKAVVRI